MHCPHLPDNALEVQIRRPSDSSLAKGVYRHKLLRIYPQHRYYDVQWVTQEAITFLENRKGADSSGWQKADDRTQYSVAAFKIKSLAITSSNHAVINATCHLNVYKGRSNGNVITDLARINLGKP